MNPQTERAAAIVEQYGCKTENLIAILQDIQAAYNYLSEANLTLVAQRLGISVSKVYSVATFYENFSLEAKGRHIIKVCAAGRRCETRWHTWLRDSSAAGKEGRSICASVAATTCCR